MAETSALSLSDNVTTSAPNVDNYYVNPTAYERGFLQRIGDWMTGRNVGAEYEALQNKKYLQYQNDYNTWLDSTKYQRAVEDLKKAGLNPWLAVQSGLSGSSSVSSGSTSATKLDSHKKGDDKVSSLFKDVVTSALKWAVILSIFG